MKRNLLVLFVGNWQWTLKGRDKREKDNIVVLRMEMKQWKFAKQYFLKQAVI